MVRAVSDKFVIRGGGDEVEVFRKFCDLCAVDRRDDAAGGRLREFGESESSGDGVNPQGMSGTYSREHGVQL